jgi:hypothetical protein
MPPDALLDCTDRKGVKSICLSEEGAIWIKDLLIYQKKLEAAPCFE